MASPSSSSSAVPIEDSVDSLTLGEGEIITAHDLAKHDDEDEHEEQQLEGLSGDLPEFSEDEQEPEQSSSAASAKKLPPPKPKGPLGRKKAPATASSLKKKLVPSALTKKPAVPAEPQQLKGVKLTPPQLDAVMAQLVASQPDLEGKLTRDDVQRFIDETGIDKSFLKGEKGLAGSGRKDIASHKFWNTQPVVKLGTPVEALPEGPLEPNKPLSSIPTQPVTLHKDLEWCSLDLESDVQRKEVYDLLTNHYVEDADATFRFDYSADFIEWALKPPGYVSSWHVGIRVASGATKGKLVAFIAGVPLDLRVREITKRSTEINFLCVHKKLRSRRLAPLLIREVTRRTHLHGIFQAIYTAGAYLPTPVSRCQYYHRNLNPAKLVKTGFSAIPRNSSVARMVQNYKMPEEVGIPGWREVRKGDLKQCARLLRAYLGRFELAQGCSNKEVEHALWAGRGREEGGQRVGQVVWTYVVEDPSSPGTITDLISFYSLPSTAVKVTPRTVINAAYLYYYATTAAPACADLGDGSTVKEGAKKWTEESEEEREVLAQRLKDLVGGALTMCQKLGFDVLNALTLQDNVLFLEELKFGRGDGFLHYYLYNYSTQPILGGIDMPEGVNKGSGVGVVML